MTADARTRLVSFVCASEINAGEAAGLSTGIHKLSVSHV